MSDVTVTVPATAIVPVFHVEGTLVPKGRKVCKTCTALVNGPRTKVCTNCGTAFPDKNKKPKVSKAKNAPKGQVGRPRKIVAVVKATDPYTFNAYAAHSSTYRDVPRVSIKAHAAAIFGSEKKYNLALDYLDTVKTVRPLVEPILNNVQFVEPPSENLGC